MIVTPIGLLNLLVVIIILAIIGVVIVYILIKPLAPPQSQRPLIALTVALLVILGIIQALGFGLHVGAP